MRMRVRISLLYMFDNDTNVVGTRFIASMRDLSREMHVPHVGIIATISRHELRRGRRKRGPYDIYVVWGTARNLHHPEHMKQKR